MEKRTYFMFVHKNKSGLWGEFPDLKGCMTDGDSLEELMRNAADALESWIADACTHGNELPTPSGIDKLKRMAAKSDEPVEFIAPVSGFLPSRPARINITSTSAKIDEITAFARKIGSSRSELMVNATLDYIRANA